MRLLSLLIFILFNSAQALDLGDGSDGVCNWNNETLNQSLYNCSSLTITGTVDIDPSITDVIFIKVQGDVEIDGTFSLAAAGSSGGPGGYNGGLGTAINGQDGVAPAGLVNARGRGGQGSVPNVMLDICAGAGGSGGRHSSDVSVDAAQSFDNVGNNCDPMVSQGGNSPSIGYGNPLDFHTLIRGGSGGGAGGGGDDGFIQESGADGGGGGGALKIYAGGDLLIRAGAQINLEGANGANSTTYAGAGGGGAGGAVLLSVLGEMELEAGAVINVSGGTGGQALGDGTDGTDGGRGHIRLEDNDGVIPGVDAGSAPNASTGLNPVAAAVTPGQGTGRSDLQYQSDISSGCALREDHSQQWSPLLLIFLVLGVVLITKIYKTSSPGMTHQG